MKAQIENFRDALRAKSYRKATVDGHVKRVKQFLRWARDENIPEAEISYTDLLQFIKYCRNKDNQRRTINQKLHALKHYFDWQIEEGKRTNNPAHELRMRNVIRTVPHDIIKWEDLEAIYKEYPTDGVVGKRNKIIYGLLIYQGLATADIKVLQTDHVRLKAGKIYIPSVDRSNSRELKLEGHQVIELKQYLDKIRPAILMLHEKETDLLFTSTGTSYRVGNVLSKMMRYLRENYFQIKGYKQIRASVLTHWLKKYNIRQVQYMAGHRYVSSTERYRTDRLEDLQEQIENLHPLK